MIDLIKLNLLFILVILLFNQILCIRTNSTDLNKELIDNKNETLINEISGNSAGDNLLIDKFKIPDELKYYLKSFNNDNLLDQNRTIDLNDKEFNKIDLINNSTNSTINQNNTIKLIDLNETTTVKSIEKEYLFKSLCSLTNNQVDGCDRYECNKNSCYCNQQYDLTVPLKSNWPIKYLCLNKANYNEYCLIDEQCSSKHQVCLSKKNFQNYLTYELDFSIIKLKLKEFIDQSFKETKLNDYANLNRELFIKQMSILYNQTKLHEFKGKCRCKTGYFYNYYLSSYKNKHLNRQVNSFLIESNSSSISDILPNQKNLFIGHCLQVRKLEESCELNTECQFNDPGSVCRKYKCKCKTGYQIEIRQQNEPLNNQTTNSILLNKLTNSTINQPTLNTTRLICEPVTNLNLELSHHHKSNDRNARITGQFKSKYNLNKNCSEELIICEGRHNCIKKSKRLHVQENFASLIWTILCMLSIMLVLCMLLVKNKQDDSLELNHNYNNYFLRNSSISNLNQTTSFLGITMFNRSHLNSANATELQSINDRSLMACTPPPEFNELIDDRPPSYAEAVRLMQEQKPNSLEV